MSYDCDRREDLEDLLTDPVYFQAVFHSLPRVKAMFQAQAELGMANESIAGAPHVRYVYHYASDENLEQKII